MASPFSAFRKHQKALLAGSMIVAMITFVFGSALTGTGGRGVDPRNAVVVELKNDSQGAVHEYELQNTRQMLNCYDEFIRHLQMLITGMPQRGTPVTEKQTMEMILMARKAEQLGMVVSDDTVKAALKSMFRGPDGQPLSRQMLSESMKAAGLSEYQLYAVQRLNLLRNGLAQVYGAGFAVDTPAQRWEYYSRFERKVTAELTPVAAQDFVASVPDPDAASLDKFFAAHKEQYPPIPYQNYVQMLATSQAPDPEYAPAGEPGFKRPYRVMLQYIKLSRSTYLEQAEKEVTDKEIEEYYEKEKETKFRVTDLPAADGKAADKVESKDTAATSDVAKPAEKKEADNKEPAKGAADPKKKPDVPMADEKAPVTKTPATKTPAANTPADPKAKQEPPKATTPAAADKAAAPKAAADSKAEPAKDAAPAETAKDATTVPAKSPYEPLDKVKDTIRKALAQERAATKMDEALARLKEPLEKYFQAHDDWQAKILDNKNAPMPTPPNLAELAKTEQATAQDTELVSIFELADRYDIGKSFNIVQMPTAIPGFNRPAQRSILSMLFDRPETAKEFFPVELEDIDGNRYLFWKTKDQKAHVPELKDVRDQVVQAWKLIEARGKALAEAKQLADKARTDSRPFKEIFPERSVIDTKEFSWLTTNPLSPRDSGKLSAVEGVPDPGEDFLRTVTQLKVGDVGVAQDYSKNTAYVVRVTHSAYSPEAYAMLFLSNMRDYNKYAPAGFDAWRGVQMAWLEQLKAEAGYQEIRPLDSNRASVPARDQDYEPYDDG